MNDNYEIHPEWPRLICEISEGKPTVTELRR